jgi:ribosome biogenesis GTPase
MVLPEGKCLREESLRFAQVGFDDGHPVADSLVPCKVKGNFRLKGIRTTNPVAVGDVVNYEMNREGFAFINRIETRRNYIIRKSSNLSKQAHILATNLDQVMLILTVAHPTTATTFIDRFLATAEAYRVPAVLVINKLDIYSDDEKHYADELAYLYRYIGYPVHLISVKTGEGLQALRDLLKGKTTLLAGNSGVGKSTLLNCLVPYANAKTAEISDTHDQGMHTTTFSEMYEMVNESKEDAAWQSDGHENTYIIDTPGIRGFGTIEFEKETVGHYFPEIFRESSECRFGNCTHTHEPGCAVLKALEEHRISQSRYDSYLSILEDEDEGKYRE